jgi:8-oxo-dGTP diphosphatase
MTQVMAGAARPGYTAAMANAGLASEGLDAARYRVVPRTLVFLRHGERVLLLRRAPDRRVWPGRFNGLGGHVEAGEDLVASARREVLEEAGLAVAGLRLAGLLHVTDAAAPEGVLVLIFTAEAHQDEVVDSAEGSLHWVPLAEAERLDLVPDVQAFLPRLWPERPERPGQPFFALSTPRAGPPRFTPEPPAEAEGP